MLGKYRPRALKLIYLLPLVVAVINSGKMRDVLFAFLVTFPFCVQNGLFWGRIRGKGGFGLSLGSSVCLLKVYMMVTWQNKNKPKDHITP